MPSETFRLQTAWAWKDKAGTKKTVLCCRSLLYHPYGLRFCRPIFKT
ncbi:hypothetical protein AB9R17_00010 [Neisseria gonorrhoeae]